MLKLRSVVMLIVAGVILASCSNSNHVVNHQLISKRKYNKGFFIKKRGFNHHSEGENLASSDEKVKKIRSSQNNFSQHESSDYASDLSIVELPTAEYESIDIAEQDFASVNSDHLSMSETVATENIEAFTEDSDREIEDRVQEESISVSPNFDKGDPLVFIFLIFLAIILPPLAIGLYDGITTIFWLDLVLFLLAWGFVFGAHLLGLAGLAAVVIALLVVFDVI